MLVEAFLSDDEESQVQRNKEAYNDCEIVKWCVGIDLVIILVIAILCIVR